ncbi:hypothetical protein BGZ94_000116 [Podila epigama]|nr:hypothetical protein BGZ94_000116 [Podila epigama]
MFQESSKYQGVIENLCQISNLGAMQKLSIPQMAIVGDQSSGKSSVLEALTKLPFPSGKNMCTGFATQVNMRRDSALQEDKLTARIKGEDQFNERYQTAASPSIFKKVFEDAIAVLIRDKIQVSEKVLEITLSGPSQSPLTLVDLPGFINTTKNNQHPSLPTTIETINGRYIKDPRIIILAVVQASIDLEMSTSLSFAGKDEHDPKKERTIPIVTKPDQIMDGMHSEWIDVIQNKVKTMKLGYLVMRNTSSKISWDEARQDEEEFFKMDPWNALPAASRDKLFEAILDLQPQLDHLMDGKYGYDYISKFNEERMSSSGDRPHFIRSTLIKFYGDYSSEMRRSLAPDFYVKMQIQIARYKDDDLPLPHYMSLNTFKNIVKAHYLPFWKSVTTVNMEKIHRQLSDDIRGFLENAAATDTSELFIRVFDRFCRLQEGKIRQGIEEIFSDESSPSCLAVVSGPAIQSSKSGGQDSSKLGISDCSQQQPQEKQRASADEVEWLTGEAMAECLKVYIKNTVEHIIDKVQMQTIERYMIKTIKDYFHMMYKVGDEDLKWMIESPVLAKRRQDLKENITEVETIFYCL